MTIKQSDLPLVRPIGVKLSPEALRWLAEVEKNFPGTTKGIITVSTNAARVEAGNSSARGGNTE